LKSDAIPWVLGFAVQADATPVVRVLITRPEPGASETAARVTAMGLTPIIAPLLDIRPIAVQLPPADTIAAILLTSGNAAGALPRRYHCIPTLTVGAASAARASQAGFTDVVSADGDATTLAALVRARIDPRQGTMLLAAGRGQSLALAAALRTSGYRVARRVVYSARPVPRLPAAALKALTNGEALAVLVFSAETARCFMGLARTAGVTGSLKNHTAITIGNLAAVALKPEYWDHVRVARKPTQDEMLALLR
jgi:uroporphyrinogen-III synthase